jgi:hypothetical protein
MSGQVGGVGASPLPAGAGAQAPALEGIVSGNSGLTANSPQITADPTAVPQGVAAPPGLGTDAGSGYAAIDPNAVGLTGTAGSDAATAGALVDPATAGNVAPAMDVGTIGLAAGIPVPVIDAIVAKALVDVLGPAATGVAGVETDPAAAAAAAQAQLGVDPAAASLVGTIPGAQAVAGSQLATPSVSTDDPLSAGAATGTAPGTADGEPELSAAAGQFLQTLLNTDPAAMTTDIAGQLSTQWAAIPVAERGYLRDRIMAEIVGPATQKLQQMATDPSTAGADAQATEQSIGQSLATISQIVST